MHLLWVNRLRNSVYEYSNSTDNNNNNNYYYYYYSYDNDNDVQRNSQPTTNQCVQ